jgi:transposase
MLCIGVDAHKCTQVAMALDGAGQPLAQCQAPNTPAGWAALAAWAQGLGEARQWGIEGAWNYGRGLAQALVAQGETVCEINTRWTAGERRRARNTGKSDRRDAQAIARYLWRAGAGLPVVGVEDTSTVRAVLVAQREAAMAEATRLRHQAHQLLLHRDPPYKAHVPALTTPAGVAALEG